MPIHILSLSHSAPPAMRCIEGKRLSERERYLWTFSATRGGKFTCHRLMTTNMAGDIFAIDDVFAFMRTSWTWYDFTRTMADVCRPLFTLHYSQAFSAGHRHLLA